MNDRNFLSWLHDRLEHVHGENPMTDYMGKLRSIIAALPEGQDTPNTAPDLETIRLATDAMTADVGATVRAGGRVWSIESDRPTEDPSPTQNIWFTDVTSPGLKDGKWEVDEYNVSILHIRLLDGRAMASRGSWAKRFTAGEYTLDPVPQPEPVCQMCDWIKGASLHPRYAQERMEGPGHTCKKQPQEDTSP